MKIEVAIEGREPYGHPINKDKTVVGSGDDCDLVLKIKGVSRKHAIVVMEDDRYYVVDQGSAGGTYINEEQLVPGQRAEFNSFFPIRLGQYVTLSLLSDEEETRTFEFGKTLPQDAVKEEPSPRAPLASAGSAPKGTNPTNAAANAKRNIIAPSAPGPKKGIEGREGLHTRKRAAAAAPKPVSEDQQRMNRIKSLALGFVLACGGAFYYFRDTLVTSGDGDAVATAPVTETAPVKAAEPQLSLRDIEFLVPAPPMTLPQQVLAGMRCATTQEMDLCSKIFLPEPTASLSGLQVAATHVTLILPALSPAQLHLKFRERFALTEGSERAWPAELDPRDQLAMYFAALSDTEWAFLTESQLWVYGIVLNSEGGSGQVYFADGRALKKGLLALKAELATTIRMQGPVALTRLSGFFRQLN